MSDLASKLSDIDRLVAAERVPVLDILNHVLGLSAVEVHGNSIDLENYEITVKGVMTATHSAATVALLKELRVPSLAIRVRASHRADKGVALVLQGLDIGEPRADTIGRRHVSLARLVDSD